MDAHTSATVLLVVLAVPQALSAFSAAFAIDCTASVAVDQVMTFLLPLPATLVPVIRQRGPEFQYIVSGELGIWLGVEEKGSPFREVFW